MDGGTCFRIRIVRYTDILIIVNSCIVSSIKWWTFGGARGAGMDPQWFITYAFHLPRNTVRATSPVMSDASVGICVLEIIETREVCKKIPAMVTEGQRRASSAIVGIAEGHGEQIGVELDAADAQTRHRVCVLPACRDRVFFGLRFCDRTGAGYFDRLSSIS